MNCFLYLSALIWKKFGGNVIPTLFAVQDGRKRNVRTKVVNNTHVARVAKIRPNEAYGYNPNVKPMCIKRSIIDHSTDQNDDVKESDSTYTNSESYLLQSATGEQKLLNVVEEKLCYVKKTFLFIFLLLKICTQRIAKVKKQFLINWNWHMDKKLNKKRGWENQLNAKLVDKANYSEELILNYKMCI